MDDFASKMGAPNMFGLIQGPANAIAPGKRPLSSMTPTIVLEDGKLRYVLGSPGGARIITTVANIFLSAAEGGLNIQEAVDAPRFHHQYLPDKLYLEPGSSAQTHCRVARNGLQGERERRPLVQWRMHRRRSEDRRVGRAARIIAATTARRPDIEPRSARGRMPRFRI